MNIIQSSNNRILKKVLLLHVPILFCLFILTDHETNYDQQQQHYDDHPKRHLAVFTALSRHPPSMRVYRGILEFILLGFCAAFSLFVWESIFEKRMIKKLLFECPYTLRTNDEEEEEDLIKYGVYELTTEEDGENVEEEENEGEEEENREKDSIQQETEEGLELEYWTRENEQESFLPSKNEKTKDEAAAVDQNISTKGNNIPSSTFVLNKSLDALLLTMISLFFFTISSSAGGQYIDQTNNNSSANNNNSNVIILSKIGLIAAPIFPLMLFFIFAIQLIFPWTKSKYHFWTCISYTLGAPFYDVTFRDGFIGDIFTSMVRPMQDMTYTCFYLLSGLNGWWVYHHRTNSDTFHVVSSIIFTPAASPTTLEEDVVLQPVEHSWLLHTIILPACMVSPLWWRYCQTLKQCYDTKKRWPYLGNSFKYFLAAQVAIFGVFFDPNKKDHFYAWLFFYIVATLYQILWDVFLDWELFTWNKNSGGVGGFLTLRSKRMYSKQFYYFVLIVNIVLRFGWILNFIPTRYLSSSTGSLEYTFSVDFTTIISPMLASAEILRRMLWGFIRFELEAIKTMQKEEEEKRGFDYFEGSDNQVGNDQNAVDGKKGMSIDHDGIEMRSMSIGTTMKKGIGMSFKSLSSVRFRNDLSTASDVELLWEVCVYATIFAFMGTVAAIHRQVL